MSLIFLMRVCVGSGKNIALISMLWGSTRMALFLRVSIRVKPSSKQKVTISKGYRCHITY